MEQVIITTRPTDFLRELADFRSGRLEVISSDSNPIPLQEGARVVLQLVPKAALDGSVSVDLSSSERPLLPLFSGGSNWRFNFDGRLTYSNGKPGVRSYVQLFHTGVVEAVAVFTERNDRKTIASTALERDLIDATSSYLQEQARLGVKLPVAMLLTLVGVKGYELAVGLDLDAYPFDRDTLLIPEVLLDSFDCQVGREMKRLFDRIWNAAGLPKCLHYDQDGNWTDSRYL
jgi:hypothetical protein